MKPAVVLAAHGSHLDASASAPAWQLTRLLEASGEFERVRVAFWKEEPSFGRVLDGLDGSAVTVVPLFMAPGYFTTQVLPAEFAPALAARPTGAPPVRFTEPLGAIPEMAEVVLAAAREAGATAETTVILAGHGTARHAGAAANLAKVGELARRAGAFEHVLAAFIDQEPGLVEVAGRARASGDDIVMVPYFFAEGWHAGTTIPADLAAAGIALRVSPPVGQHPMVADLVLRLAR